ncbi:ornithine carbamoyltransferase [Marinithermofilum abyssi]|uniref:Ornithine carbamoyltransferase n=1 Tax=Marinithermofilum abyssi TaxID=1571185 RepID=A0A8J2VFP9_9BACL|nr:ornithine carbamoyltransferase [Marinithermofilum abyssi]GGE04659.1 ornithine carbamoyltransferase [Marinithermofilum abyssi]
MSAETLEIKANSNGLKAGHCLTLADFSPQEIESILTLAKRLKKSQEEGTPERLLEGKTLAMIFDKPSTRTRVSFEAGMVQLGGAALVLHRNELQLGRGESLADTARILSGYVDGVLIRTGAHAIVEELAAHASIPVINGLTDGHHPSQALSDLFTLQEKKGKLKGLKLAYVGDGNNMLHSLLQGAAATGMHIVASVPEGYEPAADVVAEARQLAQETGAKVELTHSPKEAVTEADAVYTDVWASMGQEEEKAKREKDFTAFQVDQALMALAKPDAIFMHCLPAYRGLEVSAEVLDGPQSIVFEQAANRLHAQKALMVTLMG